MRGREEIAAFMEQVSDRWLCNDSSGGCLDPVYVLFVVDRLASESCSPGGENNGAVTREGIDRPLFLFLFLSLPVSLAIHTHTHTHTHTLKSIHIFIYYVSLGVEELNTE